MDASFVALFRTLKLKTTYQCGDARKIYDERKGARETEIVPLFFLNADRPLSIHFSLVSRFASALLRAWRCVTPAALLGNPFTEIRPCFIPQ